MPKKAFASILTNIVANLMGTPNKYPAFDGVHCESLTLLTRVVLGWLLETRSSTPRKMSLSVTGRPSESYTFTDAI